jgi:hypothetical protein
VAPNVSRASWCLELNECCRRPIDLFFNGFKALFLCTLILKCRGLRTMNAAFIFNYIVLLNAFLKP